jgi:putative SOS response-associated peptidase YedK
MATTGWQKPQWRCLCRRRADSSPKVPHWFARNEERPLFAFAGIWRPWTGERKGEAGEHLLYTFLPTEPNEVVRPVHSKAMPIILQPDEWEAWLTGPVENALALQRPLPNELLQVVATGVRKDEPSVVMV